MRLLLCHVAIVAFIDFQVQETHFGHLPKFILAFLVPKTSIFLTSIMKAT
jgi:hypothetical protein